MNLEIMNLAEAKKNELSEKYPNNWIDDLSCNFAKAYLEELLDLVEDVHNGCEIDTKYYAKNLSEYLNIMEKYESQNEFYPHSNDKLIIDYIRSLI